MLVFQQTRSLQKLDFEKIEPHNRPVFLFCAGLLCFVSISFLLRDFALFTSTLFRSVLLCFVPTVRARVRTPMFVLCTRCAWLLALIVYAGPPPVPLISFFLVAVLNTMFYRTKKSFGHGVCVQQRENRGRGNTYYRLRHLLDLDHATGGGDGGGGGCGGGGGGGRWRWWTRRWDRELGASALL